MLDRARNMGLTVLENGMEGIGYVQFSAILPIGSLMLMFDLRSITSGHAGPVTLSHELQCIDELKSLKLAIVNFSTLGHKTPS
ncbi:hypothetical protein M378DRAFT_728916 [Amanita muscaria Koide BX008]|uniref:Uncharacterized protein n=1 Tax=Amanita muscaria (strain Koide BX008) TaxID=946122 RepID=A0A0C2SIW4_AMAMK|nr:hypothetical protein M378DRAFT_728916 [Amanita muscaria Koide BX008]